MARGGRPGLTVAPTLSAAPPKTQSTLAPAGVGFGRMSGLAKAAVVVLLLSVPLLVITALPRFFELAGSIPATGSQPAAAAAPAFRLVDATPTNVRARFGALEETPPPTLAPPALTATPAATPRPTPT